MSVIGGHLTRLFDFTGRENRKPFWLWVLTVYGVTTLVSIGAMIPMFVSMFSRINQFARDHPDQAIVVDQPGQHSVQIQGWHPELMPDLGGFAILMVVVTLLGVLLLAAAVVRRLHDTDRSGYKALPYLVLQMLTLSSYAIIFPRFFSAMSTLSALGPNPPPEAVTAAMGSMVPFFLVTWLLGMVGFVFMIILIVALATRGTVGPNRYGYDLLPPPAYYPPQYPPQPQWQQPPPQWQQPQQWQPAPPAYPPPPARIVPGPWDQPPKG